MLDVVELRQSSFADLDTVGFGVAYIRDRAAEPRVGLATVDFTTDAEDEIEVGQGDSFEVAGEVWRVADVRRPTEPDWVVVLRRVGAG
jgi:Family of unknown function (DUF6406)